jgi:hypothetical protein
LESLIGSITRPARVLMSGWQLLFTTSEEFHSSEEKGKMKRKG